MTKSHKEGGYPVPDRIGIWLLRLCLLQLLADREGTGKFYWIDSKGIRSGIEDNK